MMRGLLAVGLAAALSGCCAYCELQRDLDPGLLRSQVLVNGTEKPIATLFVCNISYSLLGCVPLCSGITWKDGNYADYNENRLRFFHGECTLDENLATVHAALRECGSNRICNLINTITTDAGWSLGIFSRKVIKTTCVILEAKPQLPTGNNDKGVEL